MKLKLWHTGTASSPALSKPSSRYSGPSLLKFKTKVTVRR